MLSTPGVPHNSQSSHCIAYFCAEWDGVHNQLGDNPWKCIFKLGTSAAASEF